MRPSRTVAIAILLLVAMALLWWFRPERASLNRDSFGDTNSTLQIPIWGENATAQPVLRSKASNAASQRLARFAEDLHWEWKTPISFYGRTVDQNGNPVADATVRFSRSTADGSSIVDRASSDLDGLFSITGINGKRLQVRVSKTGYYSTRRNPIGFEYADTGESSFHVPDSANPVVFYLRKVGAGTVLITSRYGVQQSLPVRCPTNGEPLYVDLLTRKVGNSGQLQIQGWKESKDFTTGQNNWGLRLSVPDGGLIEHDDEFPFEAPQGGYVPSLEWRFTNSTPNWRGGLTRSFYIRLGPGPTFGRLKVDTSAFYSTVLLDYAINPTGSRNLEEAVTVPSPQRR